MILDIKSSVELSVFLPTVSNILRYWEQMHQLPQYLDDRLYNNFGWFVARLTAPNSIRINLGDHGIAALTDIVPGDQAVAHLTFFKLHGFTDRDRVLRDLLAAVMDQFSLRKVTATSSALNKLATRCAIRLGFRFVGMLKEHALFQKKWVDTAVFEILRKEVDNG